MAAGRICLGVIVGVHGVRGHLKIKAYTDNPAALDRYGPVSLDDGRLLHLKVKSVSPKGPVIAMAQEVTDRNEAELMRGLELFIKRDALPPTANDEVYHTDLVGLEARDNDGVAIGVIVGLHDFGAGDIIEVKPPSGPTMMLPFAPEYRDEMRLEEGFVTLLPPQGMMELAGMDGKTEDPDERVDRSKAHSTQSKGALE
ncbi:MAG: 16S rRNA processing protein RimM [SAR116 cluster bacterium]|nr:MAG: 16S rRNA processing protein RimM [SAR116 cluster bacterium]|tara:strand:+ start:142 stop:738 length:597 start_codon:yes stop_codon:yes gene_type:complete